MASSRGHQLIERLRAAVRAIQLGTVTNWFELVKDSMNPAQPHPDDWGYRRGLRMQEHRTEVDAYRLLRRLQGRLGIPRFYGLVYLPMSSSHHGLHSLSSKAEAIADRGIEPIRA
ncbi:uncharacterized protein ARMOST_15963 [Armillaria ostoyae]|uniref:Uncharacterized protein n=1 Tax=Armillaria ostoyae TaxID=47428 RepID=A0A284RUZ5_ARMOS|nr:uncharacterized protein ARMOST_15963 [Armillaria ostoyae]